MRKSIVFLLPFLTCFQTFSQVRYESLFQTDVMEFTDSTFVSVRPNWLRRFVVGNVSAIITGEGVVVFDGGNGPQVAIQTIDEIKRRTDLPVKYIIVSHGHIDHTGGLDTFRKTWPNTKIIGHETIYPYLVREQKRSRTYSQVHYDRWDKRDSLFSTTKAQFENNPSIVEYYKQYYLRDVIQLAREYENVEISLPDITIKDSVNLHLGGTTLQVFKAGNANTPSDLLLYFEKEKILFTGDVVTRPVPYGFTSYGKEWIDVLEKIIALELEWIVPGHGDPLNGKEYVKKMHELFSTIIDHIIDGVTQGLDKDTILNSLSLEGIREYFTNGDPIIEHRFDTWFLDPFFSRNYEVLSKK